MSHFLWFRGPVGSRKLIAAIVLFYTASSKDMKAVFESYAGELSATAQWGKNYSRFAFSLRYPYDILLDSCCFY